MDVLARLLRTAGILPTLLETWEIILWSNSEQMCGDSFGEDKKAFTFLKQREKANTKLGSYFNLLLMWEVGTICVCRMS